MTADVLVVVVFVSPVFELLVVVPLPAPAPVGALLVDVVVAGADVAVEGALHAPRSNSLVLLEPAGRKPA